VEESDSKEEEWSPDKKAQLATDEDIRMIARGYGMKEEEVRSLIGRLRHRGYSELSQLVSACREPLRLPPHSPLWIAKPGLRKVEYRDAEIVANSIPLDIEVVWDILKGQVFEHFSELVNVVRYCRQSLPLGLTDSDLPPKGGA